MIFEKEKTITHHIYDWYNNRKQQKKIGQMHSDAHETNYQRRAVFALPHVNKCQLLLTSVDSTNTDNDIYEWQPASPTPAIDFIWGENHNADSIVVSGGKPEERVRALMPFVNKSQKENIPVFVLHANNRSLENMIKSNSNYHEFISLGGMYYDAFRSLPVEDMAYLLYESIPEDDSSPSAEALLRAILEVLLRNEGKATFHNIASFPSAKLVDELNRLLSTGEVSMDEFNDISRDYMSGSSEIDAVRSFLNKLNRQAESIFGKPTANICNIKKVINSKGVIAFDVGPSNNELIMNFIINQIIHLQQAGKDLNILIDGIALSRHPKICELIRGRVFALSNSDFISSLYGGERNGDDIFNEVTGDITTLVLLNHKSGTSCKKWSEHLGKYNKIRIKLNISQNKSWSVNSNTEGISVDEAEEPRIRAETIAMLPNSLACIHNRNGTLIAEV